MAVIVTEEPEIRKELLKWNDEHDPRTSKPRRTIRTVERGMSLLAPLSVRNVRHGFRSQTKQPK